jgi:hypothetical protein
VGAHHSTIAHTAWPCFASTGQPAVALETDEDEDDDEGGVFYASLMDA